MINNLIEKVSLSVAFVFVILLIWLFTSLMIGINRNHTCLELGYMSGHTNLYLSSVCVKETNEEVTVINLSDIVSKK